MKHCSASGDLADSVSPVANAQIGGIRPMCREIRPVSGGICDAIVGDEGDCEVLVETETHVIRVF
jgi:hypothetical protein